MRPGEVDEEQETLLPPHRGLGELEFVDLPSPLSGESLVPSRTGPVRQLIYNREISNPRPPRFTRWELTWNGYK